eukprot:scaffold10609_cov17-Tisochrysis_lutea.AAC.1
MKGWTLTQGSQLGRKFMHSILASYQVSTEPGVSIRAGSGPGIDRLGNLLLDLEPAGLVTHGQPELSASHFSDLAMEWRDLLLGVDLDFVKSRKAYVKAAAPRLALAHACVRACEWDKGSELDSGLGLEVWLPVWLGKARKEQTGSA